MKIQKTIEIAAPPEKIWPFLVEPEKILKWCHTFKKFEYASEKRSGVGIPVYIEEKAGGPLMKLNFVVTEWAENQRLAFSLTSGTGVKKYEMRSTIESATSGSRFTFLEDFKLPWGILGRLIEFIGKSTSDKHTKEMLASLKSLTEE
jgi:uncharacterized protein YndB with AHSA1/START domain